MTENIDNPPAADETSPLLSRNTTQQADAPPASDETPVFVSDDDDQITTDRPAAETAAQRPDDVPEQFWDAEKGELAADKLLHSYRELRAKMDSGKHKAPKDGNYSLEDVGVEIAPDDEALTAFNAMARDMKLSQGDYEQLVRFYIDQQGIVADQQQYQRSQELQRLGRNGDKIIASTDAWLQRLQTSGVISSGELEALADASTSADVVIALNKIRRSYNERDVPSVVVEDAGGADMVTVQSMMADARYGKDRDYTRKVERLVYEMNGEAYPG
jgi:hypothetical protein